MADDNIMGFYNVYLRLSSRRMKFNLLFKIPALYFLKKFSFVFGLEKLTTHALRTPSAVDSDLRTLQSIQRWFPNGVELKVLYYVHIFFIFFNWGEY